LYGQLADIEEIVSIATAADIPVLEDCAEAHGARRNGKLAGSFGAVGCFSFYPTKNLGALGDGGAIVTSDENILKRLKQLRQYGWGDKYHVDIPGGRNSRLDEMQAAVLREKLPHLDDWNEQRRNIAIKYNEAFRDLPMTLPVSMELDYVAHLYVVQVENRDSFREHMKACGVATVVHFPVPDHLQKAYECTFKQGSLPVTERACDHVVTLPCYPGMTAGQVESVIEAVRTWFKPMQLAKLG
jgi:aminotransferase EvaB